MNLFPGLGYDAFPALLGNFCYILAGLIVSPSWRTPRPREHSSSRSMMYSTQYIIQEKGVESSAVYESNNVDIHEVKVGTDV
jgi:hypothetical protein